MRFGWFTRRNRIDEIEAALYGRKPKRAQELAKKFLASHPSDADGVFLLAMSFLCQERYADLVARVAPLADDLPKEGRGVIAYLLTVAATEIGDKPTAERWVGEASVEPKLRRRLQLLGLLVKPDVAYG